MLSLIFILLAHFPQGIFYDNLSAGDIMANAFIHSEAAMSSTYDNPALLGLLKNIYAFTTETPRNNTTFYTDVEGRTKTPLVGLISSRVGLYYKRVYDLNVRVDTPYRVDKERYSEYTLGLSSANSTASLGLNIKYLTALYAYAHNDTLILDFAKGISEDIGIAVHSEALTIAGAYDHIYGILKWESGEKTRIPSRFFVSLSLHPLKNTLFLNGEYEKFTYLKDGFLKGSLLFNIPYEPGKVKTGIYTGFVKGNNEYILTYGLTINKGVATLSTGFDNKGNLAITLYTSGE